MWLWHTIRTINGCHCHIWHYEWFTVSISNDALNPNSITGQLKLKWERKHTASSTNSHVTVYVFAIGTLSCPLCSDFWENPHCYWVMRGLLFFSKIATKAACTCSLCCQSIYRAQTKANEGFSFFFHTEAMTRGKFIFVVAVNGSTQVYRLCLACGWSWSSMGSSHLHYTSLV